MNEKDSIRWFVRQYDEHRVSIHAAYVAFFILLSFFPFMIFLISMLKYTPLTIHDIIHFISQFLPEQLLETVEPIIRETYGRGNLTIVSVTAFFTLFAGSKGFYSIMDELDNINETQKNTSVFLRRLHALLHTLAFSLIIIVSLLILVYGNRLMLLITKFLELPYTLDSSFVLFRYLILFLFLTIYFLYLFRVVSRHDTTLKKELPGAVFSSLMWIVFSFLYSVYADYQTSYSSIYGSLLHNVLLMLWLYLCIIIIFFGVMLNKYYRTHRRLHLFFSIRKNLSELWKLLKNNMPKSH